MFRVLNTLVVRDGIGEVGFNQGLANLTFVREIGMQIRAKTVVIARAEIGVNAANVPAHLVGGGPELGFAVEAGVVGFWIVSLCHVSQRIVRERKILCKEINPRFYHEYETTRAIVDNSTS